MNITSGRLAIEKRRPMKTMSKSSALMIQEEAAGTIAQFRVSFQAIGCAVAVASASCAWKDGVIGGSAWARNLGVDATPLRGHAELRVCGKKADTHHSLTHAHTSSYISRDGTRRSLVLFGASMSSYRQISISGDSRSTLSGGVDDMSPGDKSTGEQALASDVATPTPKERTSDKLGVVRNCKHDDLGAFDVQEEQRLRDRREIGISVRRNVAETSQ